MSMPTNPGHRAAAEPTATGTPTHAPAGGPPAWMVVLGLFMLAVGVVNGIFIWLSSHGHRDLVRPDYYEAGLRQDSVIAMAAAGGRVSLRREGGEWRLESTAGSGAATGCRLRFYRPDDGRADREVRLESAPAPAGREAWRGPAAAMRRGRWIVTAVWDHGGRDVREKTLDITEP